MGGSGSGTWYRWDKKTTCEEVKRIDIRYLKKQGMLRRNTAGSLSWSIGDEPAGTIRYTMFSNQMLLRYRFRRNGGDWEDVSQTINLNETECHYGGSRKWFLCPRCHTRVALLYGADKLFLCRHCYQLPYACQGEGYLDRISRKLRKLSKKLDADAYIDIWGTGKPKHMHWKTYHRLVTAALDTDERMNDAFLARFGYYL